MYLTLQDFCNPHDTKNWLFLGEGCYKWNYINISDFFRIHSAVHETPENILKQTVLKTKYEFSKDDIKAIDAKMNLVKKKFPLNCHVRIVSRTDEFSKKSVSNLWSETRYSVDGYKRPSDQNEPCAIYLRRLKSNTRVPGIFYPKELKVVLWYVILISEKSKANYVE